MKIVDLRKALARVLPVDRDALVAARERYGVKHHEDVRQRQEDIAGKQAAVEAWRAPEVALRQAIEADRAARHAEGRAATENESQLRTSTAAYLRVDGEYLDRLKADVLDNRDRRDAMSPAKLSKLVEAYGAYRLFIRDEAWQLPTPVLERRRKEHRVDIEAVLAGLNDEELTA